MYQMAFGPVYDAVMTVWDGFLTAVLISLCVVTVLSLLAAVAPTTQSARVTPLRSRIRPKF